ncbi:RNA-directed DNA polymerase, eukaryota, reverse transcriptase zinc-binding domain protein [Tanacetum coccineum]
METNGTLIVHDRSIALLCVGNRVENKLMRHDATAAFAFKWVWRFLAHEPTLWSRVIKAIHGANGKIDEISGKGANSCWINIIKEVRRLEEKGINLFLFMKKKLGNGLSTLFWDDVWCDGGKLKNRFPRAYALENSKQITVGQKLAHPSLYHSFRRHPRGGLELTQVEELAKVINPVVLTQSPDSWSWTLNNSGGYTVASSRNMIDSRLLPKGDLKTRWIRYVPNKVNTFAWKVMTNSLPTRFNISRRGIDIESLSCVNCDVGIETNDHLFFACNTAKKISKLINRWWDVPFMDINSYGEWRSWIDNVKLPKKNKSMFQVLITGVGIDAILCLAGTIGRTPYCTKVIGVKSGDTCFDITQKFKLSTRLFHGVNPNLNCNKLFVGEWICRGYLSPKKKGGRRGVKEKEVGVAGGSGLNFGEDTSSNVVKKTDLVGVFSGNGTDVVVLFESIRVVSEQFANSAYEIFLGKRVAYLVFANYVRNTWSKYGLIKSMLNSSNELFFFQFSSKDGFRCNQRRS